MPQSVLVLLIIIGVFAAIALIAFIVFKLLHPKLKEDKPSEDQIIKEEMDRFLKPIDDDKVAKEVSEYKDEEE